MAHCSQCLFSMSEVERDLELVFDVIPMKEELESKLLAEKQYVWSLCSIAQCIVKLLLETYYSM